MKKQTINTFIDKYSLNGTIESVKWVVDNANKQIKTASISDDKNVLSFVVIKDNAGLNDAEIGINDTAKLKKLLGVLNDEVNIAFNTREDKIVSLSLTSETTDVQYVTADLSVIPQVPLLKKLPPFNLEIPLTKEFVTTFVKAKNALSDVDTLTFTKDKKDKIKLVLGFSSVNSNRINIDFKAVEGKDTLSKTIHFSAKYLKEILTSNSDCENAVLKISDAGIAHVEFNNDTFNSSYYLVEIKNVD
jgi:hypothetical protein